MIPGYMCLFLTLSLYSTGDLIDIGGDGGGVAKGNSNKRDVHGN